MASMASMANNSWTCGRGGMTESEGESLWSGSQGGDDPQFEQGAGAQDTWDLRFPRLNIATTASVDELNEWLLSFEDFCHERGYAHLPSASKARVMLACLTIETKLALNQRHADLTDPNAIVYVLRSAKESGGFFGCRRRLRERVQMDGESVAHFADSLLALANYCNFDPRDFDIHVLDQFVQGLKDERIRRSVIKLWEPTLVEAVRVATANEESLYASGQGDETSSTVNQVQIPDDDCVEVDQRDHVQKRRGLAVKVDRQEVNVIDLVDTNESVFSPSKKPRSAITRPERGEGGASKKDRRRSSNEGSPVRGSKGLYNCRICDKPFGSRYSVLRHEKTHTNSRPFSCTVCNSSFAERYQMIKHLRDIHHVEISPPSIPIQRNSRRKSHGQRGPRRSLPARRSAGRVQAMNDQALEENSPPYKGPQEDDDKGERLAPHGSVKNVSSEQDSGDANNMDMDSPDDQYEPPAMPIIARAPLSAIASRESKPMTNVIKSLISRRKPNGGANGKRNLKSKKPKRLKKGALKSIAVNNNNDVKKAKKNKRKKCKGAYSSDPADCDVCGKTLSNIYKLKSHMALHDREANYTCAACHASYPLKGLLTSHLRECPVKLRSEAENQRREKELKVVEKEGSSNFNNDESPDNKGPASDVGDPPAQDVAVQPEERNASVTAEERNAADDDDQPEDINEQPEITNAQSKEDQEAEGADKGETEMPEKEIFSDVDGSSALPCSTE